MKSLIFGPRFGPERQPKNWDEKKHEVEQLAQELEMMGVVKERMDMADFINPVEEHVADSEVDLVEHIAAVFSEVDEVDEDPEEDLEQQDLPVVSVGQALQAIGVLLRFEDLAEQPNDEFQRLLRQRMREGSRQELQNRLQNAQQRTLDDFFDIN
jgi:hypothetical protein